MFAWLQELDLHDNEKVGPCFEKFKHLERLQVLDASHTAVRDSDLVALTNMHNLHELVLHDTGITDQGLEILAQIKSLRKLNLQSVNGITTGGLARFKKALPQCQVESQDGASVIQEIGEGLLHGTERFDNANDR